jgi:hypothetical protein
MRTVIGLLIGLCRDDIPAIKLNRLSRLNECAQWGDACRANSCD